VSANEGLDYSFIKDRLESGYVIPFLGSAPEGARDGAGLEAPAAEAAATPAPLSPPSAAKLAEMLVERTDYPREESLDLPKVAQYLKSIGGARPLYQRLHTIFSRDYALAPLHRYLARVARNTPLLVITTNYDDLVERAFAEAEIPFDLVAHVCDPDLGEQVYWRQHRRSPETGAWEDTEPVGVIPNKLDIILSATNVVYKMHGTVDRSEPSRDQYVIAEDDYIDFLTRMTQDKAIPAPIAEAFTSCHFLFLGYSLRDWNLRVVLNRINKTVGDDLQSWAIQRRPTVLERRFWRRRGVDVFDVDLSEFVEKLAG
jgi:hypothetical protein